MLANATAKARLRRGELVAAALAGAGAFHRPPCSPAELAEVTPLLLGTGGGSLGWWRVRSSGCRTSPQALELQPAYRLETLQAARHEREIQQTITLLRSSGLEPLLVKGWAVARLYPEPGLSPYGDIDPVGSAGTAVGRARRVDELHCPWSAQWTCTSDSPSR